jgi:acylphosphatase
VSGKVQGVFFRSQTRHLANKLDVTGWVRNLSDGRVEGVFEGESPDVDKLIDFMKNGPRSAKVTQVQSRKEPFKGEFREFRVVW